MPMTQVLRHIQMYSPVTALPDQHISLGIQKELAWKLRLVGRGIVDGREGRRTFIKHTENARQFWALSVD